MILASLKFVMFEFERQQAAGCHLASQALRFHTQFPSLEVLIFIEK